jgi:hypothetical protein
MDFSNVTVIEVLSITVMRGETVGFLGNIGPVAYRQRNLQPSSAVGLGQERRRSVIRRKMVVGGRQETGLKGGTE